ncbi:MAG TPA: formylglycine-generating enzyme family protein [Terriglobales bacterium]|nr:formylglycine-generating enzyme family protein [Terriglobales bacterium]
MREDMISMLIASSEVRMQHCGMAALALAVGIWWGAEVFAASTGRPLVDHHAAGESFRDCQAYCPEMVVIPPGKFTIGSPMSEAGRGSDENPQQVVTIAYALAVGKYPVTRGEFAAFVKDTGRVPGACEHWDGKSFRVEAGVYWNNTLHQTGRHPVVCVSWDDSQAYVRWLSRKTGKRYRLLSEAEWEYAARAGTTTPWYWGASEADQCRYANGADLSAKAQGVTAAGFVNCNDRYPETSPVGSFRPNPFGLYDMAGNAGEWVEDCYHDSYRDAPTDGGAVETCMQKFQNARVMRGGGWNAIPAWMRSASRDVEVPSQRADTFGFRVARTD